MVDWWCEGRGVTTRTTLNMVRVSGVGVPMPVVEGREPRSLSGEEWEGPKGMARVLEAVGGRCEVWGGRRVRVFVGDISSSPS